MKAKELGYAKDYYCRGKYFGSIIIENKDRDKTGYEGRTNHVAKEPFKVEKKRIRKGEVYQTMIMPLSGKLI